MHDVLISAWYWCLQKEMATTDIWYDVLISAWYCRRKWRLTDTDLCPCGMMFLSLHGTGACRRKWRLTDICVFVARPRRCPTLSNPVPWQNWMAAYLGYTLRMRTLFRGWPVMVHDTHTRRRRLGRQTLHALRHHLICIPMIHFCHPLFYLLVSWAWWDWPLTWLTNHCPSALRHCWASDPQNDL